MAGLLTWLVLTLPFTSKKTLGLQMRKTFNELTAAGTVKDFHLIPF
jgi:hypothetical protein